MKLTVIAQRIQGRTRRSAVTRLRRYVFWPLAMAARLTHWYNMPLFEARREEIDKGQSDIPEHNEDILKKGCYFA